MRGPTNGKHMPNMPTASRSEYIPRCTSTSSPNPAHQRTRDMKSTMCITEKALRKRVSDVYRQMKKRAQPKRWKTGRNAGNIRVQGIESLPFTREQLWDHMIAQIGPDSTPCRYCLSTGRLKPNLITMKACVIDHYVSVKQGGEYTLDNLHCVCADCNNLKGDISFLSFITIMRISYTWENAKDRASLHACMRTHGVVMRLRHDPASGAAQPSKRLQADTPEAL